MSDYEFRPYRPGDEHAILATYNVVFGEGKDDFTPRTLEDWTWAYGNNPAGTRIWVAVQGDEVAAHYASQPNRVRIEGQKRIFAQITDSMVHPAHRQGLKRQGLFATLARKMLAATCGPERDLAIFGWPVPAAWRMSKAFIGSEVVRMQTLLAAEPGSGSSELPDGVRRLERFPDDIRGLYERAGTEHGASVIRDAAWLNWRLIDNPRASYEVLAVGDATLAGYAVFRAADWPVPGSGLLVDWLVDPAEPEAAELLRLAVMAAGRASGVQRLLAMFPEWARAFAYFQSFGWRVVPSNYLTACVPYHRRYDTYWLRDNWWYTFAEMDLV